METKLKRLDLAASNKSEILQVLESGAGFVLSRICQKDYELIFGLIQEQFLHTVQKEVPEFVSEYFSAGLENYHKIHRSEHFEHNKVWHKGCRVLGPTAFSDIERTELFNDLKNVFGEFQISDEEKFGWPNVYWRLVRPGHSDIGPIHADKWFWDLGHGEMLEGFYRIKLWMALLTESGKNGLRVVPNSQLREDWKYHGEQRGKMTKPVIDEEEADLALIDLPTQSRDVVIFSDKLLHGGMPNLAEKTRLSLEFTLLVPEI